MLKRIETYISFPILRDELRKIGVNFITAGIVGVFIYHYVGTDPVTMFWASVTITTIGCVALYYGIRTQGEKQ